ncbi:MAG: SnoaL-like polyketide cyclase [Thermoleophilaceae bacterium]|nr:SnoaL-like polyketide cyclase [Thermoleophilaceae bacterium]
MSDSNVEIVRRMLDAYATGQAELALGMLAADVKWHGTVGGLEEERVYEGREAVAAGLAESLGTWEDLTLEVEELIAVGDAVLVYWHEVARFQDSDSVIEARTAAVFALADGSVVEARAYLDRAAAREAVGLDAAP